MNVEGSSHDITYGAIQTIADTEDNHGKCQREKSVSKLNRKKECYLFNHGVFHFMQKE